MNQPAEPKCYDVTILQMLREEMPSYDDGLPRYQDQEHREVALDNQGRKSGWLWKKI